MGDQSKDLLWWNPIGTLGKEQADWNMVCTKAPPAPTPSPTPAPTPYPVEIGECRWRQTDRCHPHGSRQPQNDKTCDEVIPKNASGWCDCNGDNVMDCGEKFFGCYHPVSRPGTCSLACKQPPKKPVRNE